RKNLDIERGASEVDRSRFAEPNRRPTVACPFGPDDTEFLSTTRPLSVPLVDRSLMALLSLPRTALPTRTFPPRDRRVTSA
ncbi:hypothetical protein U4E84_17740, partial [Halorubrum sp. AD140]|uniref:hypothetical protein n=1 Tax=Halorubrum sp. AD140 TaxID=3050073 RepID=UPI002ACD1E3E